MGAFSNSVCKILLWVVIARSFLSLFFFVNYKFVSISAMGKQFFSGCPPVSLGSRPLSLRAAIGNAHERFQWRRAVREVWNPSYPPFKDCKWTEKSHD